VCVCVCVCDVGYNIKYILWKQMPCHGLSSRPRNNELSTASPEHVFPKRPAS